MYERFARWCYRRYGVHGKEKAVWAWLLECALGHYRPHVRQRRLFLGEAPRTLLGDTE